MEFAKLAVGVVLYGNSSDQVDRITTSARHALRRYGAPKPAPILLYDNGGWLRPEPLPRDVDVLGSGDNRGFGAAHNALMERAFADGADIYVGANPDGAFHPDAIANLVRLHETCGGRALIEAQQFPDEHQKEYDPQTLETSWISGACFLVPRSLFAATGGFDGNIFLYCEDVDFSWAAARGGFRLLHCPTALFQHDISDRGDNGEEQAWRYKSMLVSGRYLGHKWACDWFRDWCESELRVRDAHATLPDLGCFPRLTDANREEAFQHRFAFGRTR